MIAYHHQHVEQLQRHYPEYVVFAPEEVAAIKGMGKKEAEIMLLAKKNFEGAIEETIPLEPETTPLPAEPDPVQDEMIY